MPLFGNDLAYVDSAVRDALKGILFEIAQANGGNLILGGCELTSNGTTVTVTPGYLLINYEIYYFAGTTFPVATGATGTFAASNSTDSAGLRTFANGSSQSPWQTRVAIFSPGVLAGGALDYPELKRFSGAIQDIVNGALSSSSAFTMINAWSKPIVNPAILYKNGRTVSFVGSLTPGTITQDGWTKITTLPTGYRPIRFFETVVMGFTTSPGYENGVLFVRILTNGEVYAQAGGATVWESVSLNIGYFAA